MVNLLKGRVKPAQTREKALVTLATLVGAQVIARAVDDEELSQQVLDSAFAFLLQKK
jgi:TetR/AcrR family transcriptional repressor of nem operon